MFTQGSGVPLVRLFAAIVILVSIAADIAADTRCHPLPRGDGRPELSVTTAPTDQDSCAASCAPDCFCCSTLSVVAVALPLQPAAPAGNVASAPERGCPPGIHPAPYHPPIVLS